MNSNLLTMSICLAVGVTAMAAPKENDTYNLFNNLRATAYSAETHATDLETIANTPTTSWESHARNLDYLKEDINTMGAALATLERMRDNLTPAEREEIDRTAPLLRQMASDTSSAIRLIAEVNGDTWRPSYQKSVADLVAASGRLSKTLKEFEEVARLREKETHLQKDLGLSGF